MAEETKSGVFSRGKIKGIQNLFPLNGVLIRDYRKQTALMYSNTESYDVVVRPYVGYYPPYIYRKFSLYMGYHSQIHRLKLEQSLSFVLY